MSASGLYFDTVLAAWNAVSRWTVSWHAVERYVERVSDVAAEDAIRTLVAFSYSAYRTGTVTPMGDSIWMAPSRMASGPCHVPCVVKTIGSTRMLVTVYVPRPVTVRVDDTHEAPPVEQHA